MIFIMSTETEKKVVEKVDCKRCEEKFEIGDMSETSDGFICESCINHYSSCSDCDDLFHEDSFLRIGRRDVCKNCLMDYSWCEVCESYVTDSDYNRREDMCDICYENQREEADEDSIDYRDVDLESKDGQSEEVGEVIKSTRTFGVELEMINKESENLARLSQTLERTVGVENDGSLGGGYGIEIQTPILKGKKGEETLKNILTKVKETGFGVNKTCGTHVHLGASDFKNDPETKIRLAYTERTSEDQILGFWFNHKDQDKFLSCMRGVGFRIYLFDGIKCDVKGIIEERYNATKVYGDVIGGVFEFNQDEVSVNAGRCIREINRMNHGDGIGNGALVVFEQACSKKKIASLMMHGTTGEVDKIFRSTSLYSFLQLTEENDEVNRKLQTLMSFYVSIDDILLSMLAPTRRENRYCNPIKNGYAINDILSANKYEDLEILWYKEKGNPDAKSRVEQRKGYGHDESRYCGVNFHSLIGRNNTLEIRYHGGTLDFQKIVHWVSLHQSILDKVSRGEVKIGDVKKIASITHFEKKLDFMFNLLGLSDDMRNYVIGRINTYNK